MTPSEVSQYLGLALAIIALLGHAKGYFSSGEKTLTARVGKVEEKLVEHDRRIQAVESDIEHLPDRETTHRMEVAMTKIIGRLDAQEAALAGRFETMDERLKPIQAIGERLQDVLIEQARKTG